MQNIKTQMIVDLNKAFALALSVKNCTAAVRAKELIGKLTGLFSESRSNEEGYDFKDLSDASLKKFIENAKKRSKN